MEKIYLLSCENAMPFVHSLLKELAKFCTKDEFRLLASTENYFANGEVKATLQESVRGKNIFILQCVESSAYLDKADKKHSLNDNIIALFTTIDAAKRDGAAKITVLLLPYPYSRQEKPRLREPITASLIAQFLESQGITAIVSVDIHAEAIAGFLKNVSFININTSNIMINYFQSHYAEQLNNLVVVSPDIGGAVRARYFASKLKSGLALVSKERDYTKQNKVEKVTLIGEVSGKNALIVDDMIDTGGTMVSVIKLLKKEDVKEIYIISALALFSPPCVERFDILYRDGLLHKVITTDIIHHGNDFVDNNQWCEVMSLAPLFAKLLSTLTKGRSVAELLEN